MPNVISLGEVAPQRSVVHFNRTELKLLLNLYGRRVAEGAWRDYAIDQGPDRAVFSIYRHTLERPAFTVTKQVGPRRPEYVAATVERELARSGSLADVVAALDRAPRLVESE